MNTFSRQNILRAWTEPMWGRGVHLAFYQRSLDSGTQTIYFAKPLELEKLTPELEGNIQPPLVRLNEEEAQKLMDDLWFCGIRPKEAAGSIGSMAAVQEHLKDLRRIVFKEYPKE